MPMTPKEMVKPLQKNGFKKERQTGRYTTVPMHNKDLGKGLENEILKQAGLK
ncbi:MAG: type II toxin-antitoxin system HicA family toxin [Firmicutes bacterium]|nr:type II toxin-antitoxin system HicA family toxin [Bacillota bacterium]MBQ9604732.1 type II toxin-antitoxin system HicA family toxin [Bacillota bacterium]